MKRADFISKFIIVTLETGNVLFGGVDARLKFGQNASKQNLSRLVRQLANLLFKGFETFAMILEGIQ